MLFPRSSCRFWQISCRLLCGWTSVNFRVMRRSLATSSRMFTTLSGFRAVDGRSFLETPSRCASPSLINLSNYSKTGVWVQFIFLQEFQAFHAALRVACLLKRILMLAVYSMTTKESRSYPLGCCKWTNWARTLHSGGSGSHKMNRHKPATIDFWAKLYLRDILSPGTLLFYLTLIAI